MAAILSGLADVDDGALSALSVRNPGWKIERTDAGDLSVSPTHSDSGAKSLEAAAQLRDYAKRAGGTAYDSSTGFKTPRGGVLSPNGSWISPARVAAFARSESRAYRTVTPDVVIEVRSDTDDWQEVIKKIERYRSDGATYAVAIDPDSRAVVETGRPPAGLVLDFDAIIDA